MLSLPDHTFNVRERRCVEQRRIHDLMKQEGGANKTQALPISEESMILLRETKRNHFPKVSLKRLAEIAISEAYS